MKTSWDYNENLYLDLIDFIDSKGLDSSNFEHLCHFDQIHAGGIKATEKLASMLNISSDMKLLDIGGGIGGVARFFAKKKKCKVISLDYSWKYSLTGKKLNDLCKIEDVFFINADATHLPLKNASIDNILLQHVNMNIQNKELLIYECSRVLKKKGILIFHEWFIKDSSKINEISYPLPWSDIIEHSFLTTFKNFTEIAEKFGLKIKYIENETELSLKFYKKIINDRLFSNPIFKGREPEKIFTNTINALDNNILEVFSGLFELN